MARGAAEFGKNLFTRGGQWSTCAPAHPGFILCGFHDLYGANHARVLGAAVLGAEQMIGAGLGSAKPGHGVTAGYHVLLDSKVRDKEAVDDVLRGHDQLDVAADGHMQRVDFALAFGVLEFPHPLLGYDVDFGGIARRRTLLKVDHGSPQEDHHENAERDDGPGQLKRHGTLDLFSQHALAVTIAGGEIDQRGKNQQRHHPRQYEQEDEQRIDVARHARGPLRPQWKVIEHIFCRSRS